jgi:hypothetical protein
MKGFDPVIEERTKVDPKEKGYREDMKGFSTP